MARRRRKVVEELPPEPEADEFVHSEDRIIASYKEKVNSPLTGIRSHCVECMGGSVHLIAECTTTNCSLYPFRMGKNTMHGKYGKPNPKARKVGGKKTSKA